MAIKHRSTDHQASHLHPERAKQLGFQKRKPKKPKDGTLPTTLSSLKRQVRDIRRLLNGSESLPETTRVEKERALAAFTDSIARIYSSKQRQQMIKKYHMVRFFERQKATRRLKKLQKWFRAGVDDESQAIDETAVLREIEEVKTDLDYAIYSPLNEKYVSLYPRHCDDEEDGVNVEKPPMWYFVKKCAEEGTLEDLREGRIANTPSSNHRDACPNGSSDQRIVARTSGKQKSMEDVGEDGESDDGFFTYS